MTSCPAARPDDMVHGAKTRDALPTIAPLQVVHVLASKGAKWSWLCGALPAMAAKGKLIIFVSQKAAAEELATNLARHQQISTAARGGGEGPWQYGSVDHGAGRQGVWQGHGDSKTSRRAAKALGRQGRWAARASGDVHVCRSIAHV